MVDLISYFPMAVFNVALLAAVGLVVGSYLNVVVYRLPAGISTVYPASRCPRCLMAVKPWDNIPVLSYIGLMAKCRSCKGPISMRYPGVELLTASLFVASYWRFPAQTLPILVSCGLSATLIVLALIDWDHHQVPVALILTALLAGLGFQPWLGWVSPLDALAGAGAGAMGITVASYGWKTLTRHRGFELGDTMALAMIGAFFGVEGILEIFVGAALAALLVTFFGKLLGRRRGEGLPFVTYMAASALWFQFFSQQAR